MRFTPLALLLAACSPGGGSITIDGLDDFGRVNSAVFLPSEDLTFLRLDDSGASELSVYRNHAVWFTSDKGLDCSKRQRVEDARAEAVTALLAASSDGQDWDAACAAIPDYLRALVDGPYARRTLTIDWCVQIEGGCDPVAEGDFTNDGFAGEVIYDTADDPVEAAAAAWSTETCDWVESETLESYTANQLTLNVDKVRDEKKVSGSATGSFAFAGGGANVAEYELDFTAEWCELEVTAPFLRF